MAATATRQESLANFMEVCAVDSAKAEQFLTHCDYDLERAVQLFFQTGGVLDNTNEGAQNHQNRANELRRRGGEAGSSSSSASSSSASSTNDLRAANATSRSAGTVAARQMSWLEWFIAVAALPINLIISTIHDMLEGVWGLFGGGRTPEVTDPRGDVARFIAKYQEHYAHSVQYQVPFSQDTFMEACQRAKRELRALIVFIHDENSHESSTFLRDALSSQLVGALITSNNLHVWGISTATPEGARVASQLRARSYPTLCLMMARDGRMITNLRLSAMPAERLATNLSMGINMIEMHLRQLRAAQMRREEDSRIRAEQEQEYKEALAADRKKKEDKERKEREAREKEEAAKRAEEEREECRRIIEEKREHLRSFRCGETAVEGEAVRVQIRFPSGEKTERKFSLEDTVEALFNATLAHPSCPLLFSLHTNFPRRTLPIVPEWYAEWRARAFPSEDHAPLPPPSHCARTFRDEALTQSLVVMVQDEAS
ncbi:hypothetical protein PMAYCL1PPCAC_03691 [Pristionchus mayeri]|uniref:UBX domain-containing protein n=1 Tax=Pristionchus mayeri TaxID=1317129 RepID=A0AAN4Z3W4_9BILA|nr:hypothetical protein PMAYCL1PPCAC_03691 [Pristionchus mayeri]